MSHRITYFVFIGPKMLIQCIMTGGVHSSNQFSWAERFCHQIRKEVKTSYQPSQALFHGQNHRSMMSVLTKLTHE